MKKRTGLALVIMASAAIAFAGTIQIPFFLDNGSVPTTAGFPGTGTATFVCVKNPDTAAAMTITVRYFDNDGTERTPSPNTYTIPAGAAVSWRPVATDSAEGTGAGVPNKNGGGVAGTAIITYSGTANVIGRVAVFCGNPESSYGYLIRSD